MIWKYIQVMHGGCLSWEQTHFWMLRERKLGARAISIQNQNIKNLNQKMLTSYPKPKYHKQNMKNLNQKMFPERKLGAKVISIKIKEYQKISTITKNIRITEDGTKN